MTHQDVQREFFEHRAARYDARFMRERWPRNQELKAKVIASALGDALDTGTIAEVGCGTCQIAAELLQAHPAMTYVGLDLSPSMLAVGRRRVARFGDRVELREVSGSLPIDADRIAGAFGVDVLHHVDDPAGLLRRLGERLLPGATAVFLEGNPRFPITTAIALLQREERGLFKMGLQNLGRWFHEAGFTDVSVRYGPLYTPPGPPAMTGFLDGIDHAMARIPGVRTLSLFFTASGRVPAA